MQFPQLQPPAPSAAPEISSSATSHSKYEVARGDFAVTLAERQRAIAASVEASEAGRPEQIEADHTPTQQTRSDGPPDANRTGRATHTQDTTPPSTQQTADRASADTPGDRATPDTSGATRASASEHTGAWERTATTEPAVPVTPEAPGDAHAVDYMADAVRRAAGTTAQTATRATAEVVTSAATDVVTEAMRGVLTEVVADAVAPEAQTLKGIALQATAEAVTLEAAAAPLPQGAPAKAAVLAALLASKSESATAATVPGGTAAAQELEGLAAVLQDIAALSEEAVTVQTSRVQAASASGETLTGTETGAGTASGQGLEPGQILAGPHAAQFTLDAAAAPQATGNASGAPELPPERATLGTLQQFTVRGIRYLTSRDGRTLTIKLVPASLGELHLEVASTRDGLYVRLVSAHSSVREALGAQLQGLRDALAQSDLDVAGITVATELGSGQAQVGHDSGAASSDAGAANGSPAQAMADEEMEGAVPLAATAPHEGTLDVVA